MMKKNIGWLITAVLCTGMLAGCAGASDQEAEYLKDIDADKFVTVGTYKGIEVSVTKNEVTDEQVEEAVAALLAAYPQSEETDGPVAEGDEVNIDFVGRIDGVEFEGGSSGGAGYPLVIGSGAFIDGMETSMIGMTKGETRDIAATFPDPYPNSPDLAGKEAIFTVTMNSIMRASDQQELTDEYVSWLTAATPGVPVSLPWISTMINFSGETTTAAFRDAVKAGLEQASLERYEAEKESQVVDALMAASTYQDLPQGYVKKTADMINGNITSIANQSGLDPASYLIMAGVMTADQNVDDLINEQAEMTVKRNLAFQVIADQENLAVSDSEYAELLAQSAAESGVTAEQFEAGVDLESYKEFLMLDKVSKFLVENAVEIAQ
jgi:trigger factor